MFRQSTKRGRLLILFNCKSTYKMSNCKFLPLEKSTMTTTHLYGSVDVHCRVVAGSRSVIVSILDGRFNLFRVLRFPANVLARLENFQSLVHSIKDEPFQLQSLAVAHIIARIAIETLGSFEVIHLYSSYLSIRKDKQS